MMAEADNGMAHEACLYSYALVTPARNEGAYIELTIKSVIAQTVLPMMWVIVSDGSTDCTDEIVKKYTKDYSWIELLRMPERRERHFAGKVHAFSKGYEKLQGLRYDIVGSIDADISFDDPQYFHFLLNKFAQDPQLGVAGTPFREGTVKYNYRISRKEHVSGACQLFRRECFEDIGGYVPLKIGAIDLVAVITARMKGWKTQTFTDKIIDHHRRMGSAKHSILVTSFRDGYYDYPMGVHPVWELFRTAYNVTRKPIILAGAVHMAGYLWAWLTRTEKLVSNEFVQFRRKEQIQWLKEYLRKVLNLIKFPC